MGRHFKIVPGSTTITTMSRLYLLTPQWTYPQLVDPYLIAPPTPDHKHLLPGAIWESNKPILGCPYSKSPHDGTLTVSLSSVWVNDPLLYTLIELYSVYIQPYMESHITTAQGYMHQINCYKSSSQIATNIFNIFIHFLYNL